MLSAGSVEVVCPTCRAELLADGGWVECAAGHRFPKLGAAVDFLAGQQAADAPLEISIDHAGEDAAAPWRVANYLVPQLTGLIGDLPGRAVLDDGCGGGSVVAELLAYDLDAYGIDPGSRASRWAESPATDRLFRADGANLPFRDGVFDAVLSSGVLEHLGEPLPWPERLPTQVGYVRDALRVLKPGGVAIMAAPNGAHPIDYWHARRLTAAHEATSPMRVHWPYERWMPNARRLGSWVAATGYRAEVSFLTPEKFLAFERIQRHWAGRRFSSAMQRNFRWITRHPSFAAGPVNPWLVACIRKLG